MHKLESKVKEVKKKENQERMTQTYCLKFRKRIEDYLNQYKLKSIRHEDNSPTNIHSFRDSQSQANSSFFRSRDSHSTCHTFKYSHNNSQMDRINQSVDSQQLLDIVPNTYKHEFRTRQKQKEIQPVLKLKDHHRFERVLDSIDLLERENPDFDKKLVKEKVQENQFAVAKQEGVTEVEIKNKKEFVEHALELSPRQMNKIIKKL